MAPIRDDEPLYELAAPDPADVPLSVSRTAADAPEEPKRRKARELEELRTEGNRYLLQIRLLLLALGLLMLAYNTFVYTTIYETIAEFKAAAIRNRHVQVDRAKLDRLGSSLDLVLNIETRLYFALGLGFCTLALLIHKAPATSALAALGTYLALWVLDLVLIQALLGDQAVGMALFSVGTVVKLAVIGGLWYGLQVGQAYQEQIVEPLRELSRDN